MKLFAGLSRTDYEDVLRAVGALIDERGWSNISLMEVDEGLIVQVLARPSLRQARPHLETYLLTDGDLERVQQDAVRRRKKRETPPAEAAVLPPIAAPPEPPPVLLPASGNTSSRPAPSRLVEGRLASLVAQGREGRAPQSPVNAAEEAPLPPMPALHGLPNERALGMAEEFDESAFFPQTAPLAFAPGDEDDAPIFAPAPMRFTAVPATPAYDPGAARAAVVMAHIVAARIKSGVPLTGDDPDLASLLEQVRALDEIGIGKG